MTNPTSTHTLYRFFNSAGVLLYVGRTTAPARRWREHEKGKSWFDDVATVTREVFPTAEAVDAAERLAITTEFPLHNVMLNGKRRRPSTPKFDAEGLSETLCARWAAITETTVDENGVLDVDLHLDCEGEETLCECAECHDGRMQQLDNLEEEYGWHPEVLASLEAVKRAYLTGHDLSDWYYELGDVALFWRMRLVDQSQGKPLPALTSFDGPVATAGCPFCMNLHRHFLASGAALDAPVVAGCQTIAGGRYVLIDDLDQFYNALGDWPLRNAA